MPSPRGRRSAVGGSRSVNFATGRAGPSAAQQKPKPMTVQERRRDAVWQDGAEQMHLTIRRKRRKRHRFVSTPSGFCSECLCTLEGQFVDTARGRLPLHTDAGLPGNRT